jgi:hypothetical protein
MPIDITHYNQQGRKIDGGRKKMICKENRHSQSAGIVIIYFIFRGIMDAYLVTNRSEGTLGTCKETRHHKLAEISTVYFILKIITT